jgi:hypothetical protein
LATDSSGDAAVISSGDGGFGLLNWFGGRLLIVLLATRFFGSILTRSSFASRQFGIAKNA